MSVIIQGIDFPKNCDECPFSNSSSDNCHLVGLVDESIKKCPLKPVEGIFDKIDSYRSVQVDGVGLEDLEYGKRTALDWVETEIRQYCGEDTHPVAPSRKKGHWIKAMDGKAACDECGYHWEHDYDDRLAIKPRFCPYCGADMRSEHE